MEFGPVGMFLLPRRLRPTRLRQQACAAWQIPSPRHTGRSRRHSLRPPRLDPSFLDIWESLFAFSQRSHNSRLNPIHRRSYHPSVAARGPSRPQRLPADPSFARRVRPSPNSLGCAPSESGRITLDHISHGGPLASCPARHGGSPAPYFLTSRPVPYYSFSVLFLSRMGEPAEGSGARGCTESPRADSRIACLPFIAGWIWIRFQWDFIPAVSWISLSICLTRAL